MATDKEKSHIVADPENVTELSRNTTYGDGEVKDHKFVHADPNDGDEAYVLPFIFSLYPFASNCVYYSSPRELPLIQPPFSPLR